MVKVLFRRMREVVRDNPSWTFLRYMTKEVEDHSNSTPTLLSSSQTFIQFIHKKFSDYNKSRLLIEQVQGYRPHEGRETQTRKRGRDDESRTRNIMPRATAPATNSSSVNITAPSVGHKQSCNHCGVTNHDTATCRNARTPGANCNAETPYWSSAACAKNGNKPFRPKKAQTTHRYESAAVMLVVNPSVVQHDIELNITCNTKVIKLHALIDTGAVGGNFGSIALSKAFEKCGIQPTVDNSIKSVCGIFNQCSKIINSYEVEAELFIHHSPIQSKLVIHIIDIQPNLILGRETIIKYKLHDCLNTSELHSNSQHAQNDKSQIHIHSKILKCDNCQSTCLHSTTAIDVAPAIISPTNPADTLNNFESEVTISNSNCLQTSIASISSIDLPEAVVSVPANLALVREHKSKYLTGQAAEHLESFDVQGAFEEEQILQFNADNNDNDDYKSILIDGPVELRHQIELLVYKYRDTFQSTLRKKPADVEPFKIEVDNIAKWEVPANRHPARKQSPDKQVEIDRQINLLLEAGIIEPCQASYWSQVVLAKKAGGKWRMCIDYRNLNDTVRKHGWPLPVISSTLKSIGAHRPKYFAIIDLTSGYHQMPWHKDGRQFSSFITERGLYQFTRVAFGLKSAPAYFQYTMAMKILRELIGKSCEVYLDDIIIYGNTQATFLSNVEAVLLRLRKAGLLAKPDKTRIGLSKIEYVGHIIDEHGIIF